jgi:hypothetical protein
MRSLLPVFGALLCAGASVFALETTKPTALEAIKLLPKGEAQRVARIEARDGKPVPDRWHILVHDPSENTGVREYIIAGDEIVASRNASQFAEALEESDIIGTETIRIDSDKASKLAQQYAFANNSAVAAINYELIREGMGAAPLWKINCLDESGMPVGSLVLTATKGTVVSHEGFPIEPVASTEKLTVEADTVVGDASSAEMSDTADNPPTGGQSKAAATSGATAQKTSTAPKKKTSTNSRSRESGDSAEGSPRFFRRAGGKLQRFFTGRDTISR